MRLATVEEVPDQSPPQATCSIYRAAGGARGVACRWTFAFRDPSATAFAKSLWSEVTTCRTGQPGSDDQSVNHPDSYDLLEWRTASGVYHVSVKDKGALAQTFVFLRHVETR
jgi:hypothetical protein